MYDRLPRRVRAGAISRQSARTDLSSQSAEGVAVAAKNRGKELLKGGEDRRPAGADQSVERRSSGALSGLESSDLVSDLTGSILGLSSCGASARADTSTEPVRSAGRSESGRETARASSIRSAP